MKGTFENKDLKITNQKCWIEGQADTDSTNTPQPSQLTGGVNSLKQDINHLNKKWDRHMVRRQLGCCDSNELQKRRKTTTRTRTGHEETPP